MLIQVLAALLLLLGSALVIRAFIEIDRTPRAPSRQVGRPAEGEGRLPRAA